MDSSPIHMFDPDQLEEYQERLAILVVDAGVDEWAAKALAYQIVYKRTTRIIPPAESRAWVDADRKAKGWPPIDWDSPK
jgi:hypothetical protein